MDSLSWILQAENRLPQRKGTLTVGKGKGVPRGQLWRFGVPSGGGLGVRVEQLEGLAGAEP